MATPTAKSISITAFTTSAMDTPTCPWVRMITRIRLGLDWILERKVFRYTVIRAASSTGIAASSSLEICATIARATWYSREFSRRIRAVSALAE